MMKSSILNKKVICIETVTMYYPEGLKFGQEVSVEAGVIFKLSHFSDISIYSSVYYEIFTLIPVDKQRYPNLTLSADKFKLYTSFNFINEIS